ncbi:MAG: hypothetical protein M3Q34_03035 [bacterium]|nr:hypothetical protein [bacterium]
MRIKEPFSVFSNLVFLVPLYFAILEESYVHAEIIALVFIFSSVFHIAKPPRIIWWYDTKGVSQNIKILLWVDTFMAVSLIYYNFYKFWQTGFPLEFWCAVFVSIFAFYFFFFPLKKNSDLSEGIWHLLGGIITLLAVLAQSV